MPRRLVLNFFSSSSHSAVISLLFTLISGFPVAAHEDELIDHSATPAIPLSPDFKEPEPLPATKSVEPQTFGPVAPAARQPTGSLSGRIVFMNGGHGWTFDPGAWRLLRPVLNQMNEDYGNVDQMNLFATYCFNAGAVVVPFRPLGQQNNEVVLDNDDPGVTFAGSWANSTSAIFYGSAGDVPYRSASLAATETATATYTPNLPAAGYYPVYTWVRHGSDRGDQLYRIRHTGGESQVRIPHHMVGNGWVYLGEYYFNSGSNSAAGSVVISNLRGSAGGSVIIADAIRFGNGMGSVNRGGGVSGYPREDESCRYWIQTSLGQGQASSLYDGGGNDESDHWSAVPKMAREMNREGSGNMFNRVLISFHSNAGGGRGALGLITGTPTTNQSTLAQICGREVTEDLVALGSPPLEIPWANRSTYTYTGGYSEIDGSLLNYEMDATIIEAAFHDSVDDAKLLRDSKARAAVGKAAVHALIKYFNQFAGVPLNFPPDAPENVSARGSTNGTVALTWSTPPRTGGSGAPTGYTIYRSQNGLGFGEPISVGNVTRHTISGLAPGVDYYFRISANNSGGESMPSELVGCMIPALSNSPRVLVVNAYDRFDRMTNLRQNVTRQAYVPPGATGAIERVWPRRVNAFDYVVPHGKALAMAGMAFDSCQNETVASGRIALSEYPIVIWTAGQETTGDETFSSIEQARVAEFRLAGGHLFVSGSEIAWDLSRANGPTAADRVFFNEHLKAAFASDAHDHSGSYNLVSSTNGIFAGRAAASFDDGSRGIYWVQTPDLLTPFGPGTTAALTYVGNNAGAAAIQYNGSAGGGKVVYFGFPFEAIGDSNRRNQYMSDILRFFTVPDVLVPAKSTWRYHDDGQNLGTAWASLSYDDSSWASGAAQLGFGDGDETTLVRNDPSRITTYFRRTFVIDDPRKYRNLTLRLLRDDGAVVWLNGAEVLRSNMPLNGEITWATSATSAVSGVDENTFFSHTLDARELRTGANLLTVEIHQFGTASSDLSFDLELTATRDFASTLVSSGSVWKYRDNGIAPPAHWATLGYSDSGWASGPARLGYGGDGEVTAIGFGADAQNRHITTWFRHTFDVTDADAFDALKVELQRDDGAVVYLNGVELLRENMPSSMISTSTRATVAAAGLDETAWHSFIAPASALLNGPNVLAVEVHQSEPSSSDLGFDLRLSGVAQSAFTYGQWRKLTFGSDAAQPAIAGELADPDGDSQSNLLEYALGGEPMLNQNGALSTLNTAAGRLALQFNRNSLAADLTLRVLAADDLAGPWIELARSTAGDPFNPIAPGAVVLESTRGPLRSVEVRDIFTLDDPFHRERFLRLQVEN